ncbi:MAG: hypothetical protein ABSB59_41830 [Streptosporangiaceae bacterium]
MTIPGPADLPGALTASAVGIHSLEAAAEFIIGCGCWLHRDDFTSRFITAGPDGDDAGTMMASIDWEAAISALDAGELPCSNGERRVLRLAASIAAGTPVSLSDTLTGIDDRNATLAIQAVARAAGQTWLTSNMMTDLADLLTVLDEFLRSSEEVTAFLERFLAGRGGQHPGYHASLLIDWAAFTALRHRQLAGHEARTLA